MSKTLGKILQIGAILANFIPGIGQLVSLALTLAASVNAMLMPKPKGPERQASATTLSLGEVSREVVFGETLVGGSLVDAFNYGGKEGTDWEVLISCLADHRSEALTGFYVNDAFLNYSGDGAVSGYNGQLEIYFRNGAPGQTLPSVVTTHGPGWTADDVGTGLTYVVVAYKADKPDAKNPIWTAGRPRFAFLLKGKRCYQPRKDSTVSGGSGSHRWDNPATWEWTDNPIDCRYNWARGIYALDDVADPSRLLIGRGLSAVEAPPENVHARANICDELVSLDAGGTEKRYRIDGLVGAGETHSAVEDLFALACAGVITQHEGSVELEPGVAQSAVFFFSDDDLITGSSVKVSHFLSDGDEEWVNTVLPRYVEPSQKYADHSAPVRRLTDDIVADGRPREQTLTLSMVKRWTQAGRVGEINRRLGRLWVRGTVTLGPRFAEVEEGDWGVWTSARYLKGASVTFRVQAYSSDEKWHHTLSLRQITTAVYTKDTDLQSSAVSLQQDQPPAIAAPGATAWAVSAISLTTGNAGGPGLLIAGGSDNDYAALIRFEYWPYDGVTSPSAVTNWTSAGDAGPETLRREISSVYPNTAYYVAVSYVVGGRAGTRRILGPVTTGNGATRNVDRGAWSGLSVSYVVGDEVVDAGSTWQSRTNHTSTGGNGPPTLPTTVNTNWILRAQAGAPGAPGATGSPGAAGTAALTVSALPNPVPVPCTFNGTPKAAVPGFQVKVFQGATDVTSSATYGTLTSSGVSGPSISGGGAVTVTGMTADTGYVEVPISYGGASATVRVVYTKIKDGNAATSGSIAISSLVNNGTYASSANFNITLADGQTFNINASASYLATTSVYTPQVKLAYVNVTDGGSQTDIAGSEVLGGTATSTDPETFSTSGSLTNSTGGTKVFNIRLLSRRNSGAGSSTSVIGTLGGTG